MGNSGFSYCFLNWVFVISCMKNMKRGRNKPSGDLKIAEERITILFKQAAIQAKKDNLDLSDRYVYLARKIAMKYNLKFPTHLKRRFCKYCYSYLSSNRQKIRTGKGIKKIKCLKCGRINRIIIK